MYVGISPATCKPYRPVTWYLINIHDMGFIIAASGGFTTPPTGWVAPRRRNENRVSVRSHADDPRISIQSSSPHACYKNSLAPAMAVTSEQLSGYERSVWGSFFIEYEPRPLQRSEEWMRLRVEKLKHDVCVLFKACKHVTETLTLVNALQLLGIEHLFKDKIDIALRHIHECEFNSSSLYEVAFHFRLLREHGLWVSPDVFDKFKDERGSFSEEITNEPKGLLGLYNATFLLIHGEPELEEAMSFARYHLESMRDNIKSPLAEQVKRALHIPLPRTYRRLETVYYLSEYKQEKGHNPVLLELAKLEFTLLQYVHLRELKSISRWWEDAYEHMELSYARDRLVECYTWSYTLFYEEDFEMARMMFTKILALQTVMNDTYDAHATIVECRQLNTAIQRWDSNADSLLPKYLKMFYNLLLTTFKEFEDRLGLDKRNQIAYIKKEFQKLSTYYLQEAEWSHQNFKPSFEDQLHLTSMSVGVPLLCVASAVGMGDALEKGILEWVVDFPDVVMSCANIKRLMNDISAIHLGKNKGDMPTTVECYMYDHKVNCEVAVAHIDSFMENEWKTINQARFDDPALVSAGFLRRVINYATSTSLFYGRNKEGFTYGTQLQETVVMLFVKSVLL
ncbi:unnamed protein product [Alopecurus aequalis]